MYQLQVLVTLYLFLLCHVNGWIAPPSGATAAPKRRRILSVLAANPREKVQKRWNGNYKQATSKLSDTPKSKKLFLELALPSNNDDNVDRKGRQVKILEKKRMERIQHVLSKAVLWKLFASKYPQIEIEYDVGDPDYLPDVVGLSLSTTATTAAAESSIQRILFWGECGRVKKVSKCLDLLERYPDTHIVHCRWDFTVQEIRSRFLRDVEELLEQEKEKQLEEKTEKHLPPDLDLTVEEYLKRILRKRTQPFEFCALPLDVWRFIDKDGIVRVERDDLEWQQLVI
jgi:hypothetical protein